MFMINVTVHGCRAEVIIPIICCFILLRISCNFSVLCSKFHALSQSHNHCQNNPETFEMIACYFVAMHDYFIRVLKCNLLANVY